MPNPNVSNCQFPAKLLAECISLYRAFIPQFHNFVQLYKIHIYYDQNKRRHRIMQQRKKMDTLLRDLSSCISCLRILGLLLPMRG